MSRLKFALLLLAAVGCGRGTPKDVEPTLRGSEAADGGSEPPKPTPAVSQQRLQETPSRRSNGSAIPGWGDVVDPDGDCVITQYPNWVTITVPKASHNLNPQNGRRNAPRILRDVDGDFRAVVRVTGEFLPEAPSTAQGSAPFNGAGLVLWVDEGNFLRLERNCWVVGSGARICYAPLFEGFEGGRGMNTNPPGSPATAFQGNSTALYLERRGNVVRGAYSHDARTWEGWRETTVRYPRKARVGVAAVNTSARAFTVALDGLNYSMSSRRLSSRGSGDVPSDHDRPGSLGGMDGLGGFAGPACPLRRVR